MPVFLNTGTWGKPPENAIKRKMNWSLPLVSRPLNGCLSPLFIPPFRTDSRYPEPVRAFNPAATSCPSAIELRASLALVAEAIPPSRHSFPSVSSPILATKPGTLGTSGCRANHCGHTRKAGQNHRHRSRPGAEECAGVPPFAVQLVGALLDSPSETTDEWAL